MRNFKLFLITAFICAATIGAAIAKDLTINADKQQFKMEENKAKLDGNVKVQYEDITVKSPRAEVNIDPQTKKLSDAVFFDQPYVIEVKKGKTNEIKANILKMSLINKKIRAEGNTLTTVTENFQPTVIITADTQEYDTNTKTLTANGNVIIYYKDVETFSNNAVANLDKDGNLKKITLTGNGRLKQKESIITGNRFIYDAVKEEAYAIGNTHSDVLMDDTKIKVWAARQQFNKKSNILMANGSVHVIYKDYDAKGPKATVYPDAKTGKPNEIIFIGRSTIVETTRSITADRIKMYLNPKNFFAEGNVNTVIRNVQGQDQKDVL